MKKEIFILLIKRIFSSVLVLFLLISFLFFLLRLSPGDPSLKYFSPDLSPQLAAKIRESFNLDKSLINQYSSFLLNLTRGNFGISFTYRIPVFSVIMDFLPFTLLFSITSFIIQLVLGFFLASLSIKKINGKLDKAISQISLIIYAAPTFVIGVLLVLIFSSSLNILPSSGLSSFENNSYPLIPKLMDNLSHLIMPLITLSLGGTAVFYKYLRDNFENVYNRTFITYLRSYGIPEKNIYKQNVIPNAINPLISIAGVELGILFSGALITEVIFGLPGMGRLTINAILSRDYPLIIGTTFVSGVLVIITNLVADILKVKLDKRLIKGLLN